MTDCAEAFDKLHHGILLSKLGNFGFSRGACLVMQSYLEGWLQSVKIANCFSDPFPVTSGVPQVSNLGLLLFIIYISDLLDCIEYPKILIYADDFKVFKLISDHEDCI